MKFDKKYWILMPPFAIVTFALIIILPNEKRFYAFLLMILFWITYYSWKYADKKKR